MNDQLAALAGQDARVEASGTINDIIKVVIEIHQSYVRDTHRLYNIERRLFGQDSAPNEPEKITKETVDDPSSLSRLNGAINDLIQQELLLEKAVSNLDGL